MSKRILYAEDELMIQSLFRNILIDSGYRVDCVDTGRALYTLAPLNYDLIITDIMMPEWTGEEAMQLAQSLGNKTPIIFMTGYPDTDDNLGRDYLILCKPVMINDFLDAVKLKLS